MAFLIGMLDILMNDNITMSDSDSGSELYSDGSGPRSMLTRRSIRPAVGDSDSDAEIQLPPVFDCQRDYYNNAAQSSTSSANRLSPRGGIKRKLTDGGDMDELPQSEKPTIPSLLELAAKKVGKVCTCEMLEKCNPLLDEALLKQVAFWAFPTSVEKVKAYAGLTDHYRAWTRGESLLKENKIREMWQVGFMATAYIAKYNGEEGTSSNDIRVSVTFEQQRILTSTCSDCKTDIWCNHVVAAVLYRIQKPHLVSVYAPMTETLSTLDREQLQKILQYAVYEDPGGILGKVFKYIDGVRDVCSDMNTTAGIPDPTFGGLELANSHWNMSLDLLEKNIQKSLSNLDTHSYHSTNMYYPDTYDVSKKKKAYMNWYSMRVIQLIRNEEYKDASIVLITIMKNIIQKVKPAINSACLCHYFHDICRFYAVVMVYVQDKDSSAWDLLQANAVQLARELDIADHVKQKTSLWAELPPLATAFPGLGESEVMSEPIAATRVQPPPESFYRLLEGESNISTQPEPLPVLLARLEALIIFEKRKSKGPKRVICLAFHVLKQLVPHARKYSIMGEYLPWTTPYEEMLTPPKEENDPASSAVMSPCNECGQFVGKLVHLHDAPSTSTGSRGLPGRRRGIMRPGRGGRGGLAPPRHPATFSRPSQEDQPSTSQPPLPPALILPPLPPSEADSIPSAEPHVSDPPATRNPLASGRVRRRVKSKPEVAVPAFFSPIKTRAKRRASFTPGGATPVNKKHKTTPGSKGKGAKGRGKSKSKQADKKRAVDNEVDDLFTPSQISYCVLLCCDTIIKMEGLSDGNNTSDLLLGHIMLGLELSYLRTGAVHEHMLKSSEHDWLYQIESRLTQFVQTHSTSKTRAIFLYLEAFKTVGMDHYDGIYPLILLDTLAHKISVNLELRARLSADMTDILGTILRILPGCLTFYTMPITNKYSYYYDDCAIGQSSHRDFVPYKIHTLTASFLSFAKADNSQYQDLIIQVLKAFMGLDSICALHYLMRDLQLQLCARPMKPKLLEVLLEFVIHAYKNSRGVSLPEGSVLRDQRFLQSLCGKLGLCCLQYISKDWNLLFNVKEVRDLVYLFETDIRESDTPPKAVVDLIMEVLSKSFMCTTEVCDLLSFFSIGDENHQLAVSKILFNKRSYSPTVLFTVAKQLWDNCDGKDPKDPDSDFMKVLEAAIKQIRYGAEPSNEHIDWLAVIATEGTVREIGKNLMYNNIVSMLASSGTDNPGILIRFLERLEEAGKQWLKHASVISKGLIKSYCEFFSSKLHNCSHSSYSSMINKMLCARLECVKFIDNGGRKFDEEVVTEIRQVYRTKKKFIRMLDIEFSSAIKKS